MEDKSRMSRRGFLRKAAGAAVGSIAFPYIVPSSALGKDGAVAPSNRITMGCIGMGGQGIFIMRGFLQIPQVQVVAVCDVNKDTGGYVGSGFGKSWGTGHGGREPAKRVVEEFYAAETAAGQYKGCTAYADFRELLGRSDIDTVMTAPPDHWHGIIGVAAATGGQGCLCGKTSGVHGCGGAGDLRCGEKIRSGLADGKSAAVGPEFPVCVRTGAQRANRQGAERSR